MQETVAKSRQNNFDALRLLLATLVIFSHSYLLSGMNDFEPLNWLTRGQYSLGHLAVDGFFGISGFLVTQSWDGRPILHVYLFKRFLRIYPGFIVACLVCIFVVAPFGADAIPQYFSELNWVHVFARIGLLQPLHLPPVFVEQPHARAINGSLWTIFYEFICYLFVPVAACLGWLKRREWTIAVFLVCYLVYVAYRTGHAFDDVSFGEVDFINPTMILQQLMFFSAGMVVYLYRDKFNYFNVIATGCSVGILVAALLGVVQFVTPFLVAPLMVALAFSPNLRLHQAAKYGDFSYGTYLYAYPIQECLVRLSGNSIPPFALFAIALILALGAAWISWHYVERTALSWKARIR